MDTAGSVELLKPRCEECSGWSRSEGWAGAGSSSSSWKTARRGRERFQDALPGVGQPPSKPSARTGPTGGCAGIDHLARRRGAALSRSDSTSRGARSSIRTAGRSGWQDWTLAAGLAPRDPQPPEPAPCNSTSCGGAGTPQRRGRGGGAETSGVWERDHPPRPAGGRVSPVRPTPRLRLTRPRPRATLAEVSRS